MQREDDQNTPPNNVDMNPTIDRSYFDRDVQEAEFGEANRPEDLEDPAKATGDDRQTMLDHPEPLDKAESLRVVNTPQRYQNDFVETPEGLSRPDTLGWLRPLNDDGTPPDSK